MNIKADWYVINWLRESLISKVLVSFSITVHALSLFPTLIEFLNVDYRFYVVLLGSLVFLVGYGYAGVKCPSDLRGFSSIYLAVSAFKKIKTKTILDSRAIVLQNRIARWKEGKMPTELSEPQLDHTEKKLNQYLKNSGDPEAEAEFIHADYVCHQYDEERDRWLCFGLLVIGFVMTVSPIFISFFKIIISSIQ